VVVRKVNPKSNQWTAQREAEIVLCGSVSAIRKPSVDGRGTTTTTLLQRLQLLARFEPHGFARRNGHLGAGPWIAADAGFARTNVEDAEASQLNALSMRQCSLHALKDRFHSHFGLGFGDSGLVYHFINDVELDHGVPLKDENGTECKRNPLLTMPPLRGRQEQTS